MNRVFLDANVLFSAALTEGGVARSIFEVAKERGDVALLATGYATREARINLERKAPRRIAELRALLEDVTLSEEPPAWLVERLAPLVPDPDDVPILAGAVFAGAQLLVTGDRKDFQELYGTSVQGVLVLRPRDALARLL